LGGWAGSTYLFLAAFWELIKGDLRVDFIDWYTLEFTEEFMGI